MAKVRKVRTATKLFQDGYVMHPESIGARRGGRAPPFRTFLFDQTKGCVRSMFAFENGFPTTRDLDSKDASFLSKYREPRVFAAVTEMLAEQWISVGGYTGPEVMYSADRDELTRRLGGEVKENTPGTAVGGKGATIGKSLPPKGKPRNECFAKGTLRDLGSGMKEQPVRDKEQKEDVQASSATRITGMNFYSETVGRCTPSGQ
jgi:hypothetical protein